MFLRGPDLDHLEERRRAPSHERYHFPNTGPFDLAGLAATVIGVGRAVRAGQDLEVGLVLTGSVVLGVAGAGLGAVAEGAFRGGHLVLQRRFLSWVSFGVKMASLDPMPQSCQECGVIAKSGSRSLFLRTVVVILGPPVAVVTGLSRGAASSEMLLSETRHVDSCPPEFANSKNLPTIRYPGRLVFSGHTPPSTVHRFRRTLNESSGQLW